MESPASATSTLQHDVAADVAAEVLSSEAIQRGHHHRRPKPKAKASVPPAVTDHGCKAGSQMQQDETKRARYTKWRLWPTVLAVTVLGLSLASRTPVELALSLLDTFVPVVPDADLGKDTKHFVVSRNYEFETHDMTTEDGYIISLHRLFRRGSNATSQRQIVVIGTILSGSSTIFVADPRGLAFQFAEADFDVWLLNNRGNRFGRRHVSLDPDVDRQKFFNFTFVEHGYLDMAAQIDYITRHTGQPKVSYVGISQGVASYFALLSKRPDYNEKFAKVVAYGGFRGVCFAGNSRLNFLSKLGWLIGDWLRTFGSTASTHVFADLCSRFPRVCGFIALNIVGLKSDYGINMTRLPIYAQHFPDSTSMKNLAYYTQTRQMACDGSIREFDYNFGAWGHLRSLFEQGMSENEQHYGVPQAPLIPPPKIRTPIKMYFSDDDDLAPPEEALKIAADVGIPNENLHHISDPGFTHFHFVLHSQRNDFVQHTIDFFRGGNATWPPAIENA